MLILYQFRTGNVLKRQFSLLINHPLMKCPYKVEHAPQYKGYTKSRLQGFRNYRGMCSKHQGRYAQTI